MSVGFWGWFDRLSRLDFAGTLVGLVFDWRPYALYGIGWFVSFFSLSAISDWGPGGIWVGSLASGAFIAVIYIAFTMAIGGKKNREIAAKRISLTAAAREAYSSTRKTTVATMAEVQGGDPDGIIQWYCYFMIQKYCMPVWGIRQPGVTSELIDFKGERLYFDVKDGTVTAFSHENEGRYTDLEVYETDLPPIIDKLRRFAKEVG